MIENLLVEARPPVVNWPLRLAQQAFAGMFDRSREQAGGFAAANRRQRARRALSALSTDERGTFERWLALQLVTITAEGTRDALAALDGIDAVLAAAVHAQLVRTDAQFMQPPQHWQVVRQPPNRPGSCRQPSAVR